MKVIKACAFCETALSFEDHGVVFRYTKHDDEVCKMTMRETIRMMREVLKEQAETMARKCLEFGMEIERRRGESDHDRDSRRAHEMMDALSAMHQAKGEEA